ncbi:MAG: hypothetical protein NVS3B1_06120 [Marmoricola sp.]
MSSGEQVVPAVIEAMDGSKTEIWMLEREPGVWVNAEPISGSLRSITFRGVDIPINKTLSGDTVTVDLGSLRIL